MEQHIKKIKSIVIYLVCFIFVGTLVYKQFIQIQNIFDQMFYTRIKSYSFSNMQQIKPVSRDKESNYTSDGDFESDYKEEYLGEGESLAIVFDRNNKDMEIIAVKRFNEFRIVFRYTYDIKTKKLTETVGCRYGELYSGEFNQYSEDYKEHTENLQEILLIIEKSGLTEEDLLQYKKYFLYDKLLTDWSDANFSRFSANRWGKVEYTEVLPLENSK